MLGAEADFFHRSITWLTMTSSLRSQMGECTGRWVGVILTRGEGLGDWPSSRNNQEGVGSVEAGQSKTTGLLTGMPGLNENEASSRIFEKGGEKSIESDSRVGGPVAFVGNGDYIVCGDGNKIRRWRVKDGKGVGEPMDAGSEVWSIAVSRDGKWIVSGEGYGGVTVWDAESHKEAIEFRGHNGMVLVVDISPDGTRFATGSYDKTVRVWSLSTGKQLLGPLEHDWYVVAVKFSPDGGHIATATWYRDSVRIYDGHDGCLLVDAPVQVGSPHNQSLAWAGLGKELFALSEGGSIHCIDVASGTTLSTRAIHSNNNPRCIALASNGAFIAASANSSVSFWDIATHKQIGPLIYHRYQLWYMAISANHDITISGGKKMILLKLPDILPLSYFDHVCVLSPKPNAKKTLFTTNYLQQQSDINNIQSNFPHDLTGHVTKSSSFPVASGSYGDIYKGTLNIRGGLIDVRRAFPRKKYLNNH